MLAASRAQYIKDRLDAHFLDEIGVAVAVPEPVWWVAHQDDLGSMAILGWAWPFYNPDSEEDESVSMVTVPYCPEIIDGQTAELDDEHLSAYLTLIEFVNDLHIAYWDDEVDDDERQRMIAAELLEEMPPLHRMLNDALAMATLRGLDFDIEGSE